MKAIKSFIHAISYSARLVYQTSGITVVFFFILKIVSASFPLFSAFLLKFLLDILTADMPDMANVMLCIVLYIAALVTSQGINSFINVLQNSIESKADQGYFINLYTKLSSLPMSFIDSSDGRNILDEMSCLNNVASNLIINMFDVISVFYTFCVAFVTLVRYNIWFSLLLIILTVPGTIMDFVLLKKARELRQKSAPDIRKFSYYRWMLADPWPAKDVRMYDLTEPIKERYSSLLSEILIRGGVAAFIAFVVLQALAGLCTIGNAALYVGFAFSLSASLQRIKQVLFLEFADTRELTETVLRFENIQCAEENKGIRRLERFESLEFDDVYFKYPMTDNYILSGASFILNRGDKLSLVGINGSGKSTIIKLMLGLYEIDSGRILINGYPMSDYDIKDIRKLFSALFQNFVQYPLTLRDNIALSDYSRADKDSEIIEALVQSGLYDDIKPKLKNGLDSYMSRNFDDNGTELSKGQWQKAALSRAYFKNAQIVIFDEPSAALDAEAEDRIFRNFEEISGNKTGIMISHRISAARISNKIIVLDGGKIVESGRHEELVSAGGLYSRLYNLQKEKYTAKEAE
ncbi:MAG: ABC transporter ATP-binding protein [Clostridiales bacterium]|nr:ABC transporter ATP-binding protein [Clostridiales bacterium]